MNPIYEGIYNLLQHLSKEFIAMKCNEIAFKEYLADNGIVCLIDKKTYKNIDDFLFELLAYNKKDYEKNVSCMFLSHIPNIPTIWSIRTLSGRFDIPGDIIKHFI